jgi:protein-L-isoaspartate(D-aspartate) O-methyltransferase
MAVSSRFDRQRRQLVDVLRERGIVDARVLAAVGRIAREEFVAPSVASRAYEDVALPIASGQTISQPYTVAFMTQALDVRKAMKVLEVGTGSGYQAAVLAELGARVFTIERHPDLVLSARAVLERLGYRVLVKAGDGTLGWSEYAPYDRIIVTAGAPEVPEALIRQLADGGRMLIPIGSQEMQVMTLVERAGENIRTMELDEFKFVPLVGRQAWRE